MMLQKLSLYWNTVRYTKPSQIYYRLRKVLGLRNCTLGAVPKDLPKAHFAPLASIRELDFDPVFLARFPVEELMADRVTLLHETEAFGWECEWEFPNRTPLWNFNLHYFEYAFSLIYEYRENGAEKCFEKFKECVRAWIAWNPRERGGMGWEPYTLALRLTNWLACYAEARDAIDADAAFYREFVDSVWEQYSHLAHRLEKDLLGNHYFEDLKTLVLWALLFKDEKVLECALIEFKKQCREQILPDGMHFELSPMYHKIIFEDVMRVAVALRGADKRDAEIESYLQPMLDVVYSLEEGLERIPLFNDSGNNVAKSLDALCAAAKAHFDLTPAYRDKFPDSGYYIFKRGDWKLIVDAGQPGPRYQPGHAHCDAMSFELFKAGKPVLVNCGTYAYQCEERAFFRSTAAHNTVQVEGVEQSQYWGAFRMGKRARVKQVELCEGGIVITMTDQAGHSIRRTIHMNERLTVRDEAVHGKLQASCHIARDEYCKAIADVNAQMIEQKYAKDFGRCSKVSALIYKGRGAIQLTVKLKG